MAATNRFIAPRVSNSSRLAVRSRPSTQFFVTLIAISSIPMMTGKLRIAMTTLPLFVFDAIAESIDKEAEKPKEASVSVKKKSPVS